MGYLNVQLPLDAFRFQRKFEILKLSHFTMAALRVVAALLVAVLVLDVTAARYIRNKRAVKRQDELQLVDLSSLSEEEQVTLVNELIEAAVAEALALGVIEESDLAELGLDDSKRAIWEPKKRQDEDATLDLSSLSEEEQVALAETVVAAALAELAVAEGVIEVSDLEELAKEMGLIEESP